MWNCEPVYYDAVGLKFSGFMALDSALKISSDFHATLTE